MHNNDTNEVSNSANKIYLVLCCLFCTVIVTGNLIFQKFIMLDFGFYVFEISAGVMLFPLTFLISDFVTEFFGKAASTVMINTAMICCCMTIGLIAISGYFVATEWSAVDDDTFSNVFNAFSIGAISSVIANYFGQKAEIQVYSVLKQRTGNRHLWLRNNVSTIIGQAVDTSLVVSMLVVVGFIPVQQIIPVVVSSFSFKVIMAILDTPLFYAGYYFIGKRL